MENLYKGAGNIKDHQHSLDFLDWVFFTENPHDAGLHFLTMLPKLYKKEYNHCERNMIVSDGEKWLAAVGLFIEKMSIAGEEILCGGIGNVAVSKDCRGEGYMKDCMALATEKCYDENVDFMVLGGQRQRYGYFGFEPAGTSYEYTVNGSNIRHTFGKDFESTITAEPVTEESTEALDFIFDLYNKTFISRVLRNRKALFDISLSWHQKPYIFKENGQFIGYAFYSENMDCVIESAAINSEKYRELLPVFLNISGRSTIDIKANFFSVEYNQILSDICECTNLGNSEMMNVLNWKRMVYALLNAKSKVKNLCNGKESFLIHGHKKDELFTVEIKDNQVRISDGGENPVELTHKEAMSVFLSIYSEKRNNLKAEISQWLPLEFMLFSTDMV